MTRRRATSSAALGALVWLLLASAAALAVPVPLRSSFPPLEGSVPEGFSPQQSPDVMRVLGAWVRARGPGDVTLVGLVRSLEPFRQGRERASLSAQLDGLDPVHFDDRPERFSALGFELEGLRGVAEREGQTLVRFAVPVPTVGTGAVLLVSAELSHEADARRVTWQVLASLRGPSPWRTRWQQRFDASAAHASTVGAVLTLLYALLAVSLFRRLDRWHRARGAALVVAGAAWAWVGLWAASQLEGWGPRGFGALFLVTGAVLGGQGARYLRPRAAASAVNEKAP